MCGPFWAAKRRHLDLDKAVSQPAPASLRVLAIGNEDRVKVMLHRGGYGNASIIGTNDVWDGHVLHEHAPWDIVAIAYRPDDGRDVALCRALRGGGVETAIVVSNIFSSRTKVIDVLNAGGDDCIADAMPDGELRARLAALLRRYARHQDARAIHST